MGRLLRIHSSITEVQVVNKEHEDDAPVKRLAAVAAVATLFHIITLTPTMHTQYRFTHLNKAPRTSTLLEPVCARVSVGNMVASPNDGGVEGVEAMSSGDPKDVELSSMESKTVEPLRSELDESSLLRPCSESLRRRIGSRNLLLLFAVYDLGWEGLLDRESGRGLSLDRSLDIGIWDGALDWRWLSEVWTMPCTTMSVPGGGRPRGLACSDVACAPASWLPESSPTRPVVCRSVLLDESCLIVPEPDGVSTAMRALASGIDSGCSGPTGAIVLNGCVSLTVSAVAALKFRWRWVVASVVCRAVLLSRPASRTGF